MTTDIMKVNDIRMSTLKEMSEFIKQEMKVHENLIVEAKKQIADTEQEIREWEIRGLKHNFLSESLGRWRGMELVSEMAIERLAEQLLLKKEAMKNLGDDWLEPLEEEYTDEEHEMWLLEQQEGNIKGGAMAWDI